MTASVLQRHMRHSPSFPYPFSLPSLPSPTHFLPLGENGSIILLLLFIFGRNPENAEVHEKDVNKWKKIHDSILEILQQCAEYVHDEGLLNEEQLHKYHVSG